MFFFSESSPKEKFEFFINIFLHFGPKNHNFHGHIFVSILNLYLVHQLEISLQIFHDNHLLTLFLFVALFNHVISLMELRRGGGPPKKMKFFITASILMKFGIHM